MDEVRFSADPQVRYDQCVKLHPHAGVRFKQIAPIESDDIPGLLIKDAQRYDDLIAHLRNHWDGQDATFKWVVWDTRQPQWASGSIALAAGDPILQFFAFDHLPPHLQEVSQAFHVLAEQLVRGLPRNAERTVALRKLLEAKDAAVRARLAK